MSGYRVMIDDNFHYMDKEERVELGVFVTAEEAVAASKEVVDASLSHLFRPEMTAEQLLEQYHLFGEDPFVLAATGVETVHFSAWDYAAQRATELTDRTLK
jgi:hypothetical protein